MFLVTLLWLLSQYGLVIICILVLPFLFENFANLACVRFFFSLKKIMLKKYIRCQDLNTSV